MSFSVKASKGVRYLNEEERVVEKCTLCEQRISQGELPQCVAQCGARARFFGDLDQGVANFEAPAHPDSPGCQYDEMTKTRVKLKDYVEAVQHHGDTEDDHEDQLDGNARGDVAEAVQHAQGVLQVEEHCQAAHGQSHDGAHAGGQAPSASSARCAWPS